MPTPPTPRRPLFPGPTDPPRFDDAPLPPGPEPVSPIARLQQPAPAPLFPGAVPSPAPAPPDPPPDTPPDTPTDARPGPFDPQGQPAAQPVTRPPLFGQPAPAQPAPAQPAPAQPAPAQPVPAQPASQPPLTDRALEANAYAISYRLLGDRPAAAAVAGIAAERLRQNGQASSPDWLCHLALYTLDQTVAPGVPDVPGVEADRYASLRLALRRRLARATPRERVAGALIHLAGYSPAVVAGLIGSTELQASELARVLAPPPGVAYRQLGDPQLTRSDPQHDPGARPRRSRRPRWTTVVVAVLLIAAVVVATQITGPRPTLGPPSDPTVVDEGAAPAAAPEAPDCAPVQPQRKAGPLTQLTNE